MIVLSEMIIISMMIIEYKQYKLIATPVTVLGGIYALFIMLINTFGTKLGFLKLNDYTMLMFAVYLLVLFFYGYLFSIYYKSKDTRNRSTDFIGNKLLRFQEILWKIYVVSLICYVINLIQVIEKYGINGTKSRAYGVFAHVGFISRCLVPIMIYYFIETKNIKYLIGIVINIIALIMFRGKYHLYIPVAGFMTLLLMQKKNIKIRSVICFVMIAFLGAMILFISVYTIVPNIIAGDTSWQEMSKGLVFSVRHFFHYLFCPFITSNSYFQNPEYRSITEGLRTNFNPFDTLFQQFLGRRDFFSPVISYWPVVDEFGSTANVGGIFSESVLNIGYIGTGLYVFLVGMITYYFITKCLLTGERIITTLCLSGTLMMSFFCNYFTLFANFECFAYCFLIDLFILDNRIRIGNVVLVKERICNDDKH